MPEQTHLPERRRSLTPGEADRVWSILVEKAGASPKREARQDFVHYLTSEAIHGHEFRFMGFLGFGGKLYFDDYHGATVGCYREDRDEVRDACIATVNGLLAEVVPGRVALVRAAAEAERNRA